MLKPFLAACCTSLAFATCVLTLSSPASAQVVAPTKPVTFNVSSSTQKLEMTVNTSRILTLEHNVPRMLVNNTDVVRATPLAPNQVQISAMRQGATQENVWDENGKVYTVDVIVMADVGDLERVLSAEFPEASLELRPTNTSVIISGYVPRAEMVGSIVRIAEDYYPNVINRITVGGVQQVMLKTKVMEVSRTKLRKLGVDWANLNGSDFVIQSVSGLINATATQGGSLVGTGRDTMRVGVISNNNQFGAYIDALRQYDLIKVMAEPNLVTLSGRPASFNSGGEFPIIVPQSLGTVTIQYREFGTRVDFVPIVLGNGSIRLEIRPTISEIDPSRSVTVNGISVPGLRNRWVDTAVEMKAGQTVALAGLIQERGASQNKGLPFFADLPWVGVAFRHVQEEVNEVELLIMVTPEFVDALDPEEVPHAGPGELTESPCDKDLYFKGYMEVPRGQGMSCEYGINCKGCGKKCNGRCTHCNTQNETCTDGNCTTPSQAAETIDRGLKVPGMQSSDSYRSPGTNQAPSVARRTNPQLSNNRSSRQPTPAKPVGTSGGQPALIGPVGYDVLK
ncbi:MAG TPA: pilus assembly protein N-terminal domain-containing protein [Pirellulaceae bacterium]|nr:pilus assembly protein N-terminal domain-containing protein [Pirellulaceae bacterium]